VARRRLGLESGAGRLQAADQGLALDVQELVQEALDVRGLETKALAPHQANTLQLPTMCYSDDARPPLPPISGGAADAGDIRLKAKDGNTFDAHYARAANPSGAGMVVMPDVRGLHPFYKELAEIFARSGIDAVAIDYFGRTAKDADRSEAFDWKPHVEQSTPEGVNADVAVAAEYLRSKEGGAARSVFTVGFCFGGAHSWRQSASGKGYAGNIGFYGVPARVRDVIPEMKSPLLLLIAGEDFTPREEFHRFDEELTAAHVPHAMHIYQGAPHSFFDRTYDEHRKASDDAWKRILDFVKENTAKA
jgi:carboxymethylenebutenolidase